MQNLKVTIYYNFQALQGFIIICICCIIFKGFKNHQGCRITRASCRASRIIKGASAASSSSASVSSSSSRVQGFKASSVFRLHHHHLHHHQGCIIICICFIIIKASSDMVYLAPCFKMLAGLAPLQGSSRLQEIIKGAESLEHLAGLQESSRLQGCICFPSSSSASSSSRLHLLHLFHHHQRCRITRASSRASRACKCSPCTLLSSPARLQESLEHLLGLQGAPCKHISSPARVQGLQPGRQCGGGLVFDYGASGWLGKKRQKWKYRLINDLHFFDIGRWARHS